MPASSKTAKLHTTLHEPNYRARKRQNRIIPAVMNTLQTYIRLYTETAHVLPRAPHLRASRCAKAKPI